MGTPNIINQDQIAIAGAKSQQRSSAMQPNSTDKFFNTLSEISNIAGPTAFYAVNHATGGTASNITPSAQAVAAAVNASASPMGSTGAYGTNIGGMGISGGASLSTGAYSTVGGTASIGGVGSNLESIIGQTASTQAYMLGIQMEMGNQQTTFTSVSNAMNVKHSMMKSVINNFRVA